MVLAASPGSSEDTLSQQPHISLSTLRRFCFWFMAILCLVASAHAQTFQSIPALSFTKAVNSTSNPLPQVLTVASTAASFQFSVAVSNTSGGNWLSASANGCCLSTPGVVTLTASPNVSLAAGTYTATLTLTSYDGTQKEVVPGNFMVENVSQSPDRRSLVYSANAGDAAGDEDRRHIFRVDTNGKAAEQVTRGDGLEWSPVALMGGAVAYISAGAQRPAATALFAPGGAGHTLDTGSANGYPWNALVIPKLISFQSPDGLTIQAQLFRIADAPDHQPGVIFVHGGPPRQMLLGWHYMDYYSNAYATNQYLATHGFTVLSVNYRLGIGYGRAFQHPAHAGPGGAVEYQDVLAGARYLQHVAGVDAHRIGIWGGSYGGYLTALALARNSDVFKAGVDFHGISNWIPQLAKEGVLPQQWYEVNAEWQKAVATALAASPNADLATWKSPVLLIQGDDDRNVSFDQTVDLAYRLQQHHTPVEELVIPNEIHGFLRRSDWLRADQATVEFLSRQLIGSH